MSRWCYLLLSMAFVTMQVADGRAQDSGSLMAPGTSSAQTPFVPPPAPDASVPDAPMSQHTTPAPPASSSAQPMYTDPAPRYTTPAPGSALPSTTYPMAQPATSYAPSSSSCPCQKNRAAVASPMGTLAAPQAPYAPGSQHFEGWAGGTTPRVMSPHGPGGHHARFPYYSYRRPWFTPGPVSQNVNIVW